MANTPSDLYKLQTPIYTIYLVRDITKETHWETLKQRFDEFKDPRIEVTSLPIQKGEKDKTQTGASISKWWEKTEQRTIELSLEYRYMFVTDISNCYSSIYTHSIAWAIEGKDIAKQNRKEPTLGNTIDKYIQGMQYGQTNGIPQGSTLFDFIAEIVLGYADLNLKNKLCEKKIDKYKIIRYRDDYRIFSNSKEEAEDIALTLQEVLADLNLQMNASKTRLSESIVEDAIKPDKLYYIANIPAYKGLNSLFPSLQKELYYILSIAKKYPNSGSVAKLLNNIGVRIEQAKSIAENITVLIAILVEIAVLSPKSHQLILTCISNLTNRIEDRETKEHLISETRRKLSTLPNIGHIQIWLQRMTYQLDKDCKDEQDKYGEDLCKLVEGKSVQLWNLDWLKDDLQKDFPIDKICDTKKRDKMTPCIKMEEVSIFGY